VIFTQLGRRSANAGGAAGLDAWLVSAARPESAPRAAQRAAKWDATRLDTDIVYDTANSGLPTGVRAFIQEGTRRLMFSAGEYEVLFRIAPTTTPDVFSFVGQVLHEGLPLGAASVRLAGAAETYDTDQTGGFRLPSLPIGTHNFQVATEDGVIEIAPITIGSAH
jgi:hypothetical protein